MNPAILAAIICCVIAAYWGSMTVWAASRKAKAKRSDDEA